MSTYDRLKAARDAVDYVIAKTRHGWACFVYDATENAEALGPFKAKAEAQAAADEHILRRLAEAVAG